MCALSKNTTDVLLTNGWDRIAYNVLRGLAKENLSVVFGTDYDKGKGLYSKYVNKKFIHSSFNSDPQKFIDDTIEAIKKFSPDVYIPTGEEILVVSKNISRFTELGIKVPIASYDTLIKLDDKSSATEIARQIDIPVPITIVPSSMIEIESFIAEHGHPVIFKKNVSSSAKGVYYLREAFRKQSVVEFLKKHQLRFGEFQLQKVVIGTGYGVSLLMNNGELRALFTHKRLRERIVTGGPSTLRMSTGNSMLEDHAVKLLSSVKFHGVAMVEFKYNEETGESWFLEVNPRFWGSVGLAVQAGVNFPYLLYKMAVDGDIPIQTQYKKDLKIKWLRGDISAVINDVFASKNPSHFFRLFEKCDGFDDFYKDDPLPFFAMVYLMTRRVVRKTFG